MYCSVFSSVGLQAYNIKNLKFPNLSLDEVYQFANMQPIFLYNPMSLVRIKKSTLPASAFDI
jgi:hypothetical protein